jgi:hypothetical protein
LQKWQKYEVIKLREPEYFRWSKVYYSHRNQSAFQIIIYDNLHKIIGFIGSTNKYVYTYLRPYLPYCASMLPTAKRKSSSNIIFGKHVLFYDGFSNN